MKMKWIKYCSLPYNLPSGSYDSLAKCAAWRIYGWVGWVDGKDEIDWMGWMGLAIKSVFDFLFRFKIYKTLSHIKIYNKS